MPENAINRLKHFIAIQQACTFSLENAKDLYDALPKIMETICEYSRWKFGAFWLADADNKNITCKYIWSGGNPDLKGFIEYSQDYVLPLGYGVPGRVLETARPVLLEDVSLEHDFMRLPIFIKSSLRSVVAFPLCFQEKILGVLEFFSAETQKIDKDFMRIMACIGVQIGQFIKRSQVEGELCGKQWELMDFIENGALPLHWVGGDGRIIWANQAELDMMGYTKEEYIGHPIAEFYVDADSVQNVLRRLKRNETLRNYELRLRAKDGSIKYGLLNSSALFKDGRFIHTRCFTQDITQRKEVRQQIEESEKRIKLVIDTALDAVIISNDEGVITEWNKQAEIIFGWKRKEAVGRQMVDMIIPKAYRKAHTDGMKRFLSSGEKRIMDKRIEISALNRKGIVFPVELTITSQKLGEHIYFTAFLRDITERRRNEDKLIEVTEHLQLMVESAKDYAIISTDYHGGIISWNRGAERIFGYNMEEVIGEHISIIFTPEDRQNAVPQKEIATAEKFGRAEDERWHLRKNGKLIYMSGIMATMRDADGNIRGFAKIARDQTAQKESERQLIEARNAAEAANIAKTEFLANMSHEIRTPMNAVIGLSNILGMSQPLTAKQKEYIKTLQTSADSLLALINDLLDIEKIEARTVELEQVPFSLTRIMQDIASMMAVRVKEKGLTFTGEGECVRNRMFIGDPTRLRQIILNLCSNAIKFTEKGNVHVAITCYPTGTIGMENICIHVKDTGIGIASDKLDTIFQKFFQADASINRKYGGTGLGLAITKTLVEIMGGTITVDSVFGKGSAFTVLIPLKVAEGSDIAEANGSLPEIMKNTIDVRVRPNILLVEDYMPNVMVATVFLEQFGYDCDVANNGLEAMEMVKSGNYALILMDVQMHGMNGLEATQHIRSFEKQAGKPRTPIIGMTAHAMSGDRERCLAAGMDDYIAKPFNPDDLQERIKSLLPQGE